MALDFPDSTQFELSPATRQALIDLTDATISIYIGEPMALDTDCTTILTAEQIAELRIERERKRLLDSMNYHYQEIARLRMELTKLGTPPIGVTLLSQGFQGGT